MHSASRSDIQGARRLRTEMTDAEVRLGIRLRRRQIDGYRFRRQVTMGPYVVDFACLKARLVVEVDGDPLPIPPRRGEGRPLNEMMTHGLAGIAAFRVLRFWNSDVLRRTEGVLESIRAALLGPPPFPSPQGGGKRKT